MSTKDRTQSDKRVYAGSAAYSNGSTRFTHIPSSAKATDLRTHTAPYSERGPARRRVGRTQSEYATQRPESAPNDSRRVDAFSPMSAPSTNRLIGAEEIESIMRESRNKMEQETRALKAQLEARINKVSVCGSLLPSFRVAVVSIVLFLSLSLFCTVAGRASTKVCETVGRKNRDQGRVGGEKASNKQRSDKFSSCHRIVKCVNTSRPGTTVWHLEP